MFSKRTHWPSASNPLTQALDARKKSGAPVWDLTVSNPTACGFDYLKKGLLKPFENSGNLNYEPDPKGLIGAREAVAGYYRENGAEVSADQIFITANTSEAYSYIFKLLFDSADALLAPSPGYPLLEYLTGLHDITLNTYPVVRDRSSWRLDLNALERGITPKTKGILTVHPNNPTGNYVQPEESQKVRALAKERGLALLCDEVFYDFTLPGRCGRPASFASVRDVLTLTVSGISKILGLPQMKLSWLVVTGPETLRRQAVDKLEIIADTFLSASAPVQNALPVWLEKRAPIQKELRERVASNLRFAEKNAGDRPPLSPQGGWNLCLELPGTQTDEAWALEALKTQGVFLHPGYLYDFTQKPYAVLSLLVRPGIFREGFKRLRDFIPRPHAPAQCQTVSPIP